MGYILILMATLAWSFVGVLVKSASTMVDSSIISFARFFFGVVFLGIYILIKDKKIRLNLSLKWIWIGAIGKSINYIFENIAISIGYSYANILVQPVQTVTLLIVSGLLFKEQISSKAWSAVFLCVVGVIVIGWNGLPISELLAGNGVTTLLFTLAGIASAVHMLSQRILVKNMDSGNMNLSVFLMSTVLVSIPLPFKEQSFTGPVTAWAWCTLILLGVITGLSFLWFAEGIKRVPFTVVAILGNSSVLFSILWSYLFFHEPITGYVISGTSIFLSGFLLLNFSFPRKVKTDPLKL